VLALYLGTTANVLCKNFSFTDLNDPDLKKLYVGLWGYSYKEVIVADNDIVIKTACLPYEYLNWEYDFEFENDDKLEATWALVFAVFCIGAISIIIGCSMPCFVIQTWQWKLLGFVFLLTTMFQGLTLLALRTSACNDNPAVNYFESKRYLLGTAPRFTDKCKIEVGAHLVISATVLWFVAAILILVIPPPQRYPSGTEARNPPPQRNDPVGGDEEVSPLSPDAGGEVEAPCDEGPTSSPVDSGAGGEGGDSGGGNDD
jgi:hypothetical protein